MSMSEWAAEEVRIACERKRAATTETEDDLGAIEQEYAASCYQSALKAYKSLCDDEHSGMSFGITAAILKRLLDEFPLTPIEDVPEVWTEPMESPDHQSTYQQCRRLSSLFKETDKATGKVTYSDTNRIICKSNDGFTYTNGFISHLIDEMYSITMPYMPTGRYLVRATDFDTNGQPGCFDTIGVHSVRCPDGTVQEINRFFKETLSGWTEIDRAEYYSRHNQYLSSLDYKDAHPDIIDAE